MPRAAVQGLRGRTRPPMHAHNHHPDHHCSLLTELALLTHLGTIALIALVLTAI